MEVISADPIKNLEQALRDVDALEDRRLVRFFEDRGVPMSQTFRDVYAGLPPSVQDYVDDELRAFATKSQDYSPEALKQMLLTLSVGSPVNPDIGAALSDDVENQGTLAPPSVDQESVARDWQAVAQKLRENYGLPLGGVEFPCWRLR